MNNIKIKTNNIQKIDDSLVSIKEQPSILFSGQNNIYASLIELKEIIDTSKTLELEKYKNKSFFTTMYSSKDDLKKSIILFSLISAGSFIYAFLSSNIHHNLAISLFFLLFLTFLLKRRQIDMNYLENIKTNFLRKNRQLELSLRDIKSAFLEKATNILKNKNEIYIRELLKNHYQTNIASLNIQIDKIIDSCVPENAKINLNLKEQEWMNLIDFSYDEKINKLISTIIEHQEYQSIYQELEKKTATQNHIPQNKTKNLESYDNIDFFKDTHIKTKQHNSETEDILNSLSLK